MERKPNESFEAYKVRRANANHATKIINMKAKNGGAGRAPRADRSRLAYGIKGMASSANTTYGANLKSHFDRVRAQLRVHRDRITAHVPMLKAA